MLETNVARECSRTTQQEHSLAARQRALCIARRRERGKDETLGTTGPERESTMRLTFDSNLMEVRPLNMTVKCPNPCLISL